MGEAKRKVTSDPFVTQFDGVPEFWQFLSGLASEDLITELVQNDLDAQATCTRFSFQADRLICQGDGLAVDANGWKRLSFILGAGDLAPRKQNRIGVKNHGLKACFTIGDDIIIRSDRKKSQQTLYCDGAGEDPCPGAYKSPVPDASAPSLGCQIEVPYRQHDLITKVGEQLRFKAPDIATIEQIFVRACEQIPTQFLGVLRPGLRNRYTLELSHQRFGTLTFCFSCSPAERLDKGFLFTRRCDVRSTTNLKVGSLREGAYFFIQPATTVATAETPTFYKARAGIVIEVAWRMDSKGLPISSTGRLRYPITYIGEKTSALTGVGAYYSCPFVSDLERHGLSPSAKERNDALIRHCDDALTVVLREHLMPRCGPKALLLLIDEKNSSPERLGNFVTRLLAAQALPLRSPGLSRLRFGPRTDKKGDLRPVAVATYSWDRRKIVPALVELCPPELDQVHPQVPAEIIRLLASSDIEGWQKTHLCFDENDVIENLQTHETFRRTDDSPLPTSPCNVEQARHALDVLDACCQNKRHTNENLVELRTQMYFPDAAGVAHPLSNLYVGNDLPMGIAPLGMPPLLHPRLSDHPLFKRRAWKPPRYTLEIFVENTDFDGLTEAARRRFWRWLRKHSEKVPRRSWPYLFCAPIWPTRTGTMRPLEDLCQPSNSRVRRVLSEVLWMPHTDILKLRVFRLNGRLSQALRRGPSESELEQFYRGRVSKFPQDRQLSDQEITEFRRFEKDLAVLAKDRDVSPRLRQTAIARIEGLGVSRDGFLKPVGELHRAENRVIRPLFLLPCDLLDRPDSWLDRVFPPPTEPLPDAIIRALTEDGTRTEALVARLESFVKAAQNRHDLSLATIPCIPYRDDVFPPTVFAFKGNRGDYWGEWKIGLSHEGVGAEIQELYRKAGVTKAEPNPSSSYDFFRWLNKQPFSELPRHLAPIIRHLTHRNGVTRWWQNHPDLPCIPVAIGCEIRLVGLRMVRQRNSPVFLPDFPELEKAIRDTGKNSRAMLAIVSHEDVELPATDQLCPVMKSLRAAAGTPFEIWGEGEINEFPEALHAISDLLSPRMHNLRKRLVKLDISSDSLRDHWRDRLAQIRDVFLAQKVIGVYKLGRRKYSFEIASGFDGGSEILWVRQSTDSSAKASLFRALADRVFIDGAPKYAPGALRDAVQDEFHELGSTQFRVSVNGGSEGFTAEELDEQNAGPGETRRTHPRLRLDTSRNLPRPRHLTSGAQRPQRHTMGKARDTGSASRPARVSPKLESLHREELCRDHYAWHCQLCLAQKSPTELAPRGSYVEFQENRHLIFRAHHPDQVHAGGARNGANMLILCQYHHSQVGDALTRDDITRALRGNAHAKAITFSIDELNNSKKQILRGYIANIRPFGFRKRFRLFFTKEHREYWLEGVSSTLTIRK
jgi:hypothetical protein